MEKIAVFGIIFMLVFSVPVNTMHFHGKISNFADEIKNGKILYVGGDGPNNYTKIQDAINDASDGDTIFVYDDSSPYYENLVINKSIRLVGENKDTTIIDGRKLGNVIYILAEGVQISEFTIRGGGGGSPGAGIFIYSSNNVIFNNTIRDNIEGIVIEDLVSKGNNVYKNVIVNNTATGIHVLNADGNFIKENNVLDNGVDGIVVADAGSNIIEKNVLADTIYLGRAYGNIVKDNSFSKGGIRFWYSSGIVLNNTINGKEIVYLENKKDMVIEDGGQVILVRCEKIKIKNLSISNTCCAIYLLGCKKCIVEDSHLENNANGIEMWESSFCIIKNNVIKNNECGILFVWSTNFNRVIKNLFIGNKINAFFASSLLNLWLRNYWSNWRIPLPKPILGTLISIIPWIQFDWMPRLFPYGEK